jgi:hypothetical protein
MAINPTAAGPYYSSGAISFGSLRSNFRAQQINGTFNTDILRIKASELIRVTSQTATNPIVPDATENSSIPTSVGAGVSIKASHFRNSIKYYYLTQSETNDNTGNSSAPGLSLSSADWNSNLNKNIRKKLIISGTVGSRYNTQPAFSFSGEMCNLTISVIGGGGIYGAGGVLATNSGRGGVAMYVNNTFSSSPVHITIDNFRAQIYGGGGVGGIGGTGGTGGTGGGAESYAQGLIARSSIPYGGGGGPGGPGGAGGSGRGYNNSNVTGSPGSGGSGGGGGTVYRPNDRNFRYPQYSETGNSVFSWYSGSGGTGGTGGYGGYGGDWGTGGDPGKVGNTGFGGNPSTGALFLAVSITGNVTYRATSDAGHTNYIYISNMITLYMQGEGKSTGGYQNLGYYAAGLYGPVQMFDASIDLERSPNGTYLNGPASFLADDNGADRGDWNDLIVRFGGNVYGVYTPLYGAGGSGGTGGLPGAAGGAAITGSNYSVSGIVNTNTIKGSK